MEMFVRVVMFVDRGVSQIYFVTRFLSSEKHFVIDTDVALVEITEEKLN